MNTDQAIVPRASVVASRIGRRAMYAIDLESADGLRLEGAFHNAQVEKPIAVVVTAHDLGQDMDEGGMYLRLAERLAHEGIATLRFSFRGHGGSDGLARDVTLTDLTRDLEAAFDVATADNPSRCYLVASGFGTVPATLSVPRLGARLHALILWQPTLDLRETFLEPRLPWGMANFGPAARRGLERDGYLTVDGEFELGRALFEEMRHHDPVTSLTRTDVPVLIVHGDQDDVASHDTALAVATAHRRNALHTIRGARHGFDVRSHEDEALEVTTDWILRRHHAVP
jgi:alpha-beta hydrolase superfamily lysophospholipase